VQTFEQDLPGANTAGFNTSEIGGLPLETSLTMNNSWGFNITDRNFKTTTQLIHYLVRAAGYGANLLLNVGPRPDGTIQPGSGRAPEGNGSVDGDLRPIDPRDARRADSAA
jgi:alpha-L-fucosidase